MLNTRRRIEPVVLSVGVSLEGRIGPGGERTQRKVRFF